MTERKNRTVHASWPGWEVVRYGKQGKWALEPTGKGEKMAFTLEQAANAARFGVSHGGEVFLGRPGGKAFDEMVDGK